MLALIWGLSVVQLAVWVIGIAAIVAIVVIVLRRMGVTPPEWFIQILWVILAAFVGIAAIMIVASMMRGA